MKEPILLYWHFYIDTFKIRQVIDITEHIQYNTRQSILQKT